MGKSYFTLRYDGDYQAFSSFCDMDTAAPAGTSSRLLIAPAVLLLTAGAAVACSSGSPSATRPAGTSSSGTAAGTASGATALAAAGTETPPPGDIPDSTVYLPYRAPAGQYQVKVPEGWARTVTGGGISFTDKLNTISVTVVSAKAPTLASARTVEVPKIQGAVRHFTLAGIGAVQRPAGSVVLIRYSADSQPDPVTGKVYPDAVERYEFSRNGLEAIVTVSGPKGADNVDPWRTVTSSFRWLR
ncbi:MAG: hypothetical protein QOG28_6288 [Trebonia sp.]|nr:hypothetical protein [Trebonia sp.]